MEAPSSCLIAWTQFWWLVNEHWCWDMDKISLWLYLAKYVILYKLRKNDSVQPNQAWEQLVRFPMPLIHLMCHIIWDMMLTSSPCWSWPKALSIGIGLVSFLVEVFCLLTAWRQLNFFTRKVYEPDISWMMLKLCRIYEMEFTVIYEMSS